MPPLEPQEASGIITASEQIIKEYASKVGLNAQPIKVLIEDVLHNPAFNADDGRSFHRKVSVMDLDAVEMRRERVRESRRRGAATLKRRRLAAASADAAAGWAAE